MFHLVRPPLSLVRAGTKFLAALALSLGLAQAANAEKPLPRNLVYVESNIGEEGQNSILAFKRAADGSLTPLPGSPFLTGGRGVFDLSLNLGPFDSDQNIVVNPNHTRLFAVNSGSNSVAVFRIHRDGSLTPIWGSPFASGGINPVSVGLADDTLVVVNKDQDPAQDPTQSLPNYTTFHVANDGYLVPVPFSTIYDSPGSSPTQALISPNEKFCFGADFMGGLLQSFSVRHNGRLWQNPPQPLPASEFVGTAAPRFPLGLQVHPKHRILYVGFVTIARLGVYKYDDAGILQFVRTVPNSGKAICWLFANKAGTRLYTSNTGDNSVSVYDLSDPLAPVEIQKVTLKGFGSPLQLALDPAEKFLHVVSQRTNTATPLGEGNVLHVLKVDDNGLLTEVASSPTTLPAPPGTRSQGIIAL